MLFVALVFIQYILLFVTCRTPMNIYSLSTKKLNGVLN